MSQTIVFISYKHCERDAAILERLKTFLDPLEREGLIWGWTDRDIAGGQKWREEIEAALEQARIGVLLISQDFLASEFIQEVELPRLLAREAAGATTILPVFLSPADQQYEIVFSEDTGVRRRVRLSDLQGFARPDRTLAHMAPVEQDEIFVALVNRIRELVADLPPQPVTPEIPPSPIPALPTLNLRLDCAGDMLRVEALHPQSLRSTRAHRTRLADLYHALADQDHEALFRALFESPSELREFISTADGLPATGEPTATPLRLRLLCTSLEAASPPWHCIAHGGRRLGEAGWIIETLCDTEPRDQIQTIALDNPLVVAPADPTLSISARSHATTVTAHIRCLLAESAPVPWVSSYRELEVALDQEPDILYVFAQIIDDGGLGLALGKDAGQRELYPLERLGERIRGFHSRPLVWLHLLPGDQTGLLRAQLWRQLHPYTRLLLLQLTTPGRQDSSLRNTLEWMDALAAANANTEPAAVLSRLGGHRDTHLWLGDRSIGLSPRTDRDAALIDYIRAALIRLLLGRRSEKRQLNSGVRERPEGHLAFYGVCGDGQACVHDFPEQARHYMEDLDPHILVEIRPLPLTMGTIPELDAAGLEEEVANQLRRDLNISPLISAREALERIPVVPPDQGDIPIIALSWLLEPAPDFAPADFTPEFLANWLRAWKQGVLDVLDKEQLPPDFRLLVGACIQWPDAWLDCDRDASTLQGLQETIDRVLGRGNPRDYVHCIEMQRPLSLLRKTDLEDFYDDAERRQRLRAQELRIHRLVDYILGKTGGRFQATVELIYAECKYGYADFRDSLTGSDP